MTSELINIEKEINFSQAKERLDDILVDTSLIYSSYFSDLSGNNVYLKPENLQMTGSFKIRGAFNKVSKLTEEEKAKGIITASAGNHAQGVAYAAKALGVNATILMPETTPLIKVQSTKNFNPDANVILHGDCYDDAYEEALRLKELHGYTFVHPFNDADVIEGQGTIALEILEQCKDADYILVPIGGGGLVSGVAMAAKQIKPSIKIIGVEPQEASCMKDSLKEDKIVTLDTVNTIADGTAVKTPGDLNFLVSKEYVDEVITVTDFEVMSVFTDLIQRHKIISENSGSLSVAASLKLKAEGKNVVSLISGGNIDILAISSLIDKGLVLNGRLFSFTVEVPHKPGQLEKVSSLLAKTGGNIISIRHSAKNCENIFTNINLEVTVETNGREHIKQIRDLFTENNYNIKGIVLNN
ncbi:MAG TPA: threonine ammonia-lyase [Tissierellaceae bacterium]